MSLCVVSAKRCCAESSLALATHMLHNLALASQAFAFSTRHKLWLSFSKHFKSFELESPQQFVLEDERVDFHQRSNPVYIIH
eukprot:4223091-Amphidinium_carterae.1